MALKDAVEELVEAAEEGSSQASSRRPHDDASLVPSSDDDSEGDEDEGNILWTIDEAQMKRYEACRRSGLGNCEINRMLTKIIGTVVSEDVKIVLSAASKLFIGNLIETALEVMSKRNDSGPIRLEHIAESYMICEERIIESLSTRDRYLKAYQLRADI